MLACLVWFSSVQYYSQVLKAIAKKVKVEKNLSDMSCKVRIFLKILEKKSWYILDRFIKLIYAFIDCIKCGQFYCWDFILPQHFSAVDAHYSSLQNCDTI